MSCLMPTYCVMHDASGISDAYSRQRAACNTGELQLMSKVDVNSIRKLSQQRLIGLTEIIGNVASSNPGHASSRHERELFGWGT